MADEEENEEGAEEEGGGGGSKLPLIIAGVNTLGLIGLAAFIMLKPDPQPVVGGTEGDPVAEVDQEGLPRAGTANQVGVMFELGQMIINLAEPSGDRYLKAKLNLELDTEETQGELEARMAQVKYQLHVLLSGQRVADVQGPENMESLRRAMRKRINNVLPKGRVRDVWPVEWVVQ